MILAMGQFRKHEASGQAVWSLYCGFRRQIENRSTERDKIPLGSIDSIAWLPIPHIGCSARSTRHSRSPEWSYRSWLAGYLPSLALDAGGNQRIAAAHNIPGWAKRQAILLLVFGSTKRNIMVCALSWFWDRETRDTKIVDKRDKVTQLYFGVMKPQLRVVAHAKL